MAIYLPPQETKKWTQLNLGDLMGTLWATFNIDLNLRKGKLLLSPRLKVVNDSDDDADLGYPTAAVKGEDTATFTFVRSLSVAAKDTFPTNVYIRPNGNTMYILGNTGDSVYQYLLSTPWDISTATYFQVLDISAGGTAPKGLFFKPDGLKMYVQDGSAEINEYALSTAWDISSATLTQTLNTTAEDANGGIFFKPNGLTLYLAGQATDTIYQYNLSTAWNISTAVLAQSFVALLGLVDVFFKSSGLKMYTVNNTGPTANKVNEYLLSTAYNISSAVFTQSFDVSGKDTNCNGLFIKPDDATLYIIGSTSDSVHQYSIPTSYKWWVLANGAIFKSSDGTASAFTQEAPTVPLTDINHITSDLAVHEGKVFASSKTGLNYTYGGDWTLLTPGGAFLTDSVPHPLHVYNRLLLVGNDNLVHQVDRDLALVQSQLTFPLQYQVRCIRSTPNRVWFALKNKFGGKAGVGEWDGYSGTYLNIYEIEGSTPFALGVKDGVPYVVTNAGILFKFNGSTFAPEAYFPIYSEDIYQDSPSSRVVAEWKDAFTDQFLVGSNGIEVIDDNIHILISGAIGGVAYQTLENMPSGVWCYDPDYGLYHRYSFGKFKTVDTVKDYSTVVIDRPGFLAKLPDNDGSFLAGVTIQTNATPTLLHLIATKDSAEAFTTIKRGSFITPQIHTSNIQEMWDKIWAKFKMFRGTDTKIVFKIRSAEDENYNLPFKASIIWTSGTVFTSTDTNFANVVAGQEIFVLLGDGAGATAHVLTITVLTETYTITLDETVGAVTGTSTARVRVTNWRKIETISSTTITKDDFALNEDSDWIQLKVELRGLKDDPELQEMIVSTTPSIKTEN